MINTRRWFIQAFLSSFGAFLGVRSSAQPDVRALKHERYELGGREWNVWPWDEHNQHWIAVGSTIGNECIGVHLMGTSKADVNRKVRLFCNPPSQREALARFDRVRNDLEKACKRT